MRDNLTPCRRDSSKGNHVYRDPLYRTWQVGMVCSRCGRRKRTQAQVAEQARRHARFNNDRAA